MEWSEWWVKGMKPLDQDINTVWMNVVNEGAVWTSVNEGMVKVWRKLTKLRMKWTEWNEGSEMNCES